MWFIATPCLKRRSGGRPNLPGVQFRLKTRVLVSTQFMASFALILPAAGRSIRFGADKLMGSLAGRPVLSHSLGAFLCRRDVAIVVIPCRTGPGADPFADAPAGPEAAC